MIWNKNEKIMYSLYTPVNPKFYYIKVGCKGILNITMRNMLLVNKINPEILFFFLSIFLGDLFSPRFHNEHVLTRNCVPFLPYIMKLT